MDEKFEILSPEAFEASYEQAGPGDPDVVPDDEPEEPEEGETEDPELPDDIPDEDPEDEE